MNRKIPDRPNILYIMTDQQHHGMMSCAGNPHVTTPAMDSIAEQGTRFGLAYSANPVCVPARTAMMTGHYPGHFGIGTNADGKVHPVPESDLKTCMGHLLHNGGYETVFGGKTHWACNMDPHSIGFREMLTRDSYDELADRAVEFLNRDHDRPFALVTSFHNPHDICLMAIDAFTQAEGLEQRYPQMKQAREHLSEALEIPEYISREEFFDTVCPPLPDNHEIPEGEPPEAGSIADFQEWVRKHWKEEDWRLHRWAYCRLAESVDRQIGRVLDALRNRGLEENTVIIFSSDHGDMDSAHRLEHKPFFYEEASRVPFIVSWKGVTPAGHTDMTHPVSASVDLLPTVCGFAGIEPPDGLPGTSVRSLALGNEDPGSKSHVIVERHNGRMIRGSRYKYCVYSGEGLQEQLFDLETDPGEMSNRAQDPAYADILRDHRSRLREWTESYGDTAGKTYVPAEV